MKRDMVLTKGSPGRGVQTLERVLERKRERVREL